MNTDFPVVDDQENPEEPTDGGTGGDFAIVDDQAAAGEQTVAEADANYRCAECQRDFPVDDVWNSEGRIICKACYAALEPASVVIEVPAATVTQEATPTEIEPLPQVVPEAKPQAAVVAKPQAAPQVMGITKDRKIVCPHCWERFLLHRILWVSEHAELLGDMILGPDAASRFLPTRFTVEGLAIDARGMCCHTLACPRCHLVIPRPLIDNDPLFFSIVGVPASGKSYFLTAMTWQLRRSMLEQFGIIFSDADVISNQILNQYEELLFLQPDPARLVAIRKTEVHGMALYDQIRFGEQIVSLPQPFLFSLRTAQQNATPQAQTKVDRVLCLYDNAGEAFDPGEESSASPVTQHLSRSRVLMFLFDPTQDVRLRSMCKNVSADPQLDGKARRQETVLLEAATRVRRYLGLPANYRTDKPLLIIVPKADVWAKLIDLDLDQEPLIPPHGNLQHWSVHVPRVEAVSAQTRRMLLSFVPELVAVAEDFSQNVVYIPVSALGCSPIGHEQAEGLFVRAGDIRPKWVTVPLLYAFCKWATGMIHAGGFAGKASGGPPAC